MTADDPLDVVLAGGGAAALEALMALRDLAGDRGRLALVAPEPEFELKAFRTVEPFAVGHVRRRTMRAFADRFGADLRRDSIARVDPEGRVVELTSGDQLAYDELVLTVGARARPAHRHAITFGMEPRSDELWLMLREIGSGIVRSVAFVVPSQTSWPLPLYEVALMTAREGRRSGVSDLRLDVISPESAPLGVFGPQASDAVAALLAQAHVAFLGMAHAEVPGPSTIRLGRGGEETQVDQADAVAEHIAGRVVTGLEPRPFRAVLRGKLLKGRGAAYLRRGPGRRRRGQRGGRRPALVTADEGQRAVSVAVAHAGRAGRRPRPHARGGRHRGHRAARRAPAHPPARSGR